MSEIVDQGLRKIVKGTGIALFGTVAGMGLALGSRVLLARSFSQSEYGIFALAFVVLNIASVISMLGLRHGTARQIAFYRGKGDTLKVQGVVTSSLQTALITSLLFAVILFFTTELISTKIFHEPRLALTLKIFSIAIPFSVLIHILATVFQGFGDVRPVVYFEKILRNATFVLLLVPVIVFRLSFQIGMYAFLASFILTSVAFVVYTIKKAPFQIKGKRWLTINPEGKELLLFSLPLLGATVLSMVMGWTDTLMLGYFTSPEDVGLYNASLTLAQIIPWMLGSMRFIYVPIISQLYSQNLVDEMKRSYQVSTKWIFFFSLPVFLILVLFPEIVLNFFFSAQYVAAAPALQILSLGFMFHTFLGANGMTLVVIGRTRLVMWVSILAVASNIILNVILIPKWGIIGAAVALLFSYFVVNVFNSVKLYQISKIHPFNQSYLKSIIASGVAVFAIYILNKILLSNSYWVVPSSFILFLVIYVLLLLLTKSFGKEDINMLLAIEKRIGINATFVKKVLRKFL